jgi:hypothetical protein
LKHGQLSFVTLSGSHHIQQFTYFSPTSWDHGFEEVEMGGSVLIAGPFNNLLFGPKTYRQLNCKLGEWFPRAASNSTRLQAMSEKGGAIRRWVTEDSLYDRQ